MAPGDKKTKKNKKDKKKPGRATLGTSRGIETMFRTSYRVNMDLSSLADAKSNMIMGVNSIVISVVLAGLSSKIDANPRLLLPTSILLLGCLISLAPRQRPLLQRLLTLRKNLMVLPLSGI